MRLIDADALLHTLGVADDCGDCPYDAGVFCGNKDGFITACEAISDAPTIATEPHWIPVTERLPDKNGRYLVTCSKIGAWVVDWNIWYCEPKPGWLWEQGVTAWMPLPEPWEGEQQDG